MNKEAINNYYFLYIHNFLPASLLSLSISLSSSAYLKKIQDHFKIKIKKCDYVITYPLCIIFHQFSETK